MTPEKTMFCADCGNDDIVWRVWADEFDNISHSCEDKFVFCNDCDDETRPVQNVSYSGMRRMSTARNKEVKS